MFISRPGGFSRSAFFVVYFCVLVDTPSALTKVYVYLNHKNTVMSTYKFIEVKDYGETTCPHCGSEGRYIYYWEEDGKRRAAMPGCFKLLTGQLEKGDTEKHIERIAVKQAKNKPLNGWDKTIVRMLAYRQENADDPGKVNWANLKIFDAVAQAKKYSARFR